MPWHLPSELKHFKNVTMGKAIIMGRKTWEAIGKPLPGRQNIVVSRNPDFEASGCEVCSTFGQAIETARGSDIMVIGGGALYRMALRLADRMILTMVDCKPPADTWFPQWDHSDWRLVSSRVVEADEENEYGYEIQEWVRR